MNEKYSLLNIVSNSSSFDTVALGTTVKLLRERLNLTQTQLGELSSVSAAEISKLENGSRKKLPLDTLIKISPHLNVSIDYLIVSCTPDFISDHEHFYNYEGKEIDLYNIARNLYSVDAELLLLISSTDFLGDKEFIYFIKLWLKSKNKLKISTNKLSHGQFLTDLFENLKVYCTRFLQSVLQQPLTKSTK